MKYFSILVTSALFLSPLTAMNEFDELAHQITDDIRANRPVTPKFVESWYDHGDQKHIKAVCDAFPLSEDSAVRSREIRELEDYLVEDDSEEEQTKFHDMVGRLSPEKREPITLLLTNYMVGIPQ